MFKKLLLLFCCMPLLTLQAQLYERGKKNFYAEPGIYAGFINAKKSAFTGNRPSPAGGFSAGKIFSDFFRVGLVYRYHRQDYTVNDTTARFYMHHAGLQADVKIPLFNVYLGKSNHYECTVLHNYLFVGAEYGLNFGSAPENSSTAAGEFLLSAAYGVKIKKSGSTKKQAAYDFYVLLNMKKGMNALLKTGAAAQPLYGTYWGLSFMLVKYRTGRWN